MPWSRKIRAVPLLPLWAVRPVQSLSACTVQLYLYSPQCLYSTAVPLLPSVPVQYSYTSTPLSTCTVQLYLYSPQYLYSTAIPLLPSVPVQYSYTSTAPMGRTACTQPYGLYTVAPYLPYLTYVRFPFLKQLRNSQFNVTSLLTLTPIFITPHALRTPAHYQCACLKCLIFVFLTRKITKLNTFNDHIINNNKRTRCWWCSWLWHCATSRKVAGSIPDGVIEIFHDKFLPIALWPWG